MVEARHTLPGSPAEGLQYWEEICQGLAAAGRRCDAHVVHSGGAARRFRPHHRLHREQNLDPRPCTQGGAGRMSSERLGLVSSHQGEEGRPLPP